jgi:hypothetical protein
VFNDEFAEFSVPKIQQKLVDDLMLQIDIDKVINFPDLVQLKIAEQRLKLLGALEDAIVDGDSVKKGEKLTKVTLLGRTVFNVTFLLKLEITIEISTKARARRALDPSPRILLITRRARTRAETL